MVRINDSILASDHLSYNMVMPAGHVIRASKRDIIPSDWISIEWRLYPPEALCTQASQGITHLQSKTAPLGA